MSEQHSGDVEPRKILWWKIRSGVSILKQKSLGNDIIYVTPIEEFFDKIDEQHKATGHVGRDKVLHNLKKNVIFQNWLLKYTENYARLAISQKHRNMPVWW